MPHALVVVVVKKSFQPTVAINISSSFVPIFAILSWICREFDYSAGPVGPGLLK